MPLTTNEIILTKTYEADFSDFTNVQSGAPKSYVDYKAGQGTTNISEQIKNLRFEILGVTGQSMLTVAQQNFDTIKEIADRLAQNVSDQTSLQAAIDAETVARKAGLTGAYDALAVEIARATAAENTILAGLTAETQARVAAIDNEATLRAAADAAIQASLDAEIVARKDGISGEAWARGAADAAIQASLDAYKAANDAKLAGFTYDSANNVYNYDSSIKINSTNSQLKYFYLSSTFRTYADDNNLNIQVLDPNTGSFTTVFSLAA